jgi:hypothetical protein
MKHLVLSIFIFCFAVQLQAQNVGIGNANPASKLEIGNNSSIRPSIGIIDSATNGLGTVRFKNSVRTNRFMELEGWTFSTFARDNYLDIKSDSGILATFRGDGHFGIGTVSPTERLHVNGNINLTGNIKVNGNAGTAGQVLTSNGNNDPTWETMRSNYPANMRMMIPVALTPVPNKLERNLRFGATTYNTSAGAIIVTDSAITFNETGLYELEGKIHFRPGAVNVDFPYVIPSASLRIFADYGAGVTANYIQISQRVAAFRVGSYRELIPFRFTTHITAGTVFRFPVNIFDYDFDVCCDVVDIPEGYISILRVD